MDNSLELLVHECLDEALLDYPAVRQAYLVDAEVHQGFKCVAQVLTAVAFVMQNEGIAADTAELVIKRTWQVSIHRTLHELTSLGLKLP
jgi:hypothetical protein